MDSADGAADLRRRAAPSARTRHGGEAMDAALEIRLRAEPAPCQLATSCSPIILKQIRMQRRCTHRQVAAPLIVISYQIGRFIFQVACLFASGWPFIDFAGKTADYLTLGFELPMDTSLCSGL